jgi:hypothetical protein
MTDTIKPKKIRAVIGADKMPDGDFVPLLHRSLNGLTTNSTVYAKPPIDLTKYAAGLSDYEGAIPAALDGGKTAIAQKKKLCVTVTKRYRELAHYVEANCNEDMASFCPVFKPRRQPKRRRSRWHNRRSFPSLKVL